MLNDMPVGRPVGVTNLSSLNDFFGFVYCTVTTPEDLTNPILPRRENVNGRDTITLSRGTWDGWYFSEELKYAVTQGYIVTPQTGIQFNRGKGVFNSYIEHFFNLKKKAIGVSRVFANTILNCLYGRWGMADRAEHMRIIERGKAYTFDVNYRLISHVSDRYSLVGVTGRMNKDITKILKEAELIKSTEVSQATPRYGKATAVHVAAAIAAYARVSINDFKNLKDNPIAYTDTDSVVVQHKIADSFVGGMMNLEHEVEEGVFIRSNAYGIKTNEGKTIIK